jgi:hypothetical protein
MSSVFGYTASSEGVTVINKYYTTLPKDSNNNYDMRSVKITNVANPTLDQDVVTLSYYQANDQMREISTTDQIVIGSNDLTAISPLGLKTFRDSYLIVKNGDNFDAKSSKIMNVSDPTEDNDAVNKSYVDSHISDPSTVADLTVTGDLNVEGIVQSNRSAVRVLVDYDFTRNLIIRYTGTDPTPVDNTVFPDFEIYRNGTTSDIRNFVTQRDGYLYLNSSWNMNTTVAYSIDACVNPSLDSECTLICRVCMVGLNAVDDNSRFRFGFTNEEHYDMTTTNMVCAELMHDQTSPTMTLGVRTHNATWIGTSMSFAHDMPHGPAQSDFRTYKFVFKRTGADTFVLTAYYRPDDAVNEWTQLGPSELYISQSGLDTPLRPFFQVVSNGSGTDMLGYNLFGVDYFQVIGLKMDTTLDYI